MFADGVREEFTLALELERVAIPVGATGSMAKKLADGALKSRAQSKDVNDLIKLLFKPTKDLMSLVDPVARAALAAKEL